MSIRYIEYNMDLSVSIYEEPSDNRLIATAQKIAIYSVIPMMMVILFEAIVKNLLLINLGNLGIFTLNKLHDFIGDR